MPPRYASVDGYNYAMEAGEIVLSWSLRDMCIKRGMWAIVDEYWTGALAQWIGGREALEIMAGAGWLSLALRGHGVNIVATDDYSWDKHRHAGIKRVIPVKKMRADRAAAKIEADVLIVSWPPYEERGIVEACTAWGTERPIVYIGESEGGCCAPDEFFEHFEPMPDAPDIPLMCWPTIHDRVMIGKWREANARDDAAG